MTEQEIGHVTHYWDQIHVAGIHVDHGELKVGDRIHVIGHTSDFEQTVGSMQLEHSAISEAHEGEDIGLRVAERAREHDRVFKILM